MTIDKLIKELKHLKITTANLKDIAFLCGGQYLAPSLWRNGKIPVITNCDGIYGYTNKANRNKPCISISSRGYAGKTIQYWKIPIWASQCITITQKDSTVISLKYLYYYLLSIANKISSLSATGAIGALYIRDLENLKIKYPPIAYQEIIVKIFDQFIDLKNSLNQELNLRTNQYQYWLHYLLNPKHNSFLKHAPKYQLSNLCLINKGKQLNKNLLSDNEQYPVYNGGIELSGYWSAYNTNKDKIIISQGGCSAGYVNWINTNFWAGAHCYVVFNQSNKLNYRYLYYYLKSIQHQLFNLKKGAGIPGIAKEDLDQVQIIVPTLEIQELIVKHLDLFNQLINNPQTGILKELELRTKQYHYYLKLILDF